MATGGGFLEFCPRAFGRSSLSLRFLRLGFSEKLGRRDIIRIGATGCLDKVNNL